ncbi:hypothetical protein [Zhihengliuella salsuginis]|uniref:DUF4190 domain-containing protein n=1 Tax=Zhihengliuella salsuginis TaxID=578222 RepID=A0ABQ3GI37_9MICC|nr:hypothetical protein [Zhihengliuella salsuginis]GHD05896.1 hypothetical protein GCM10008096_15260 [Zhihengliuella salsuginis]
MSNQIHTGVARTSAGKGLGVAALVTAIVAIVLSALPIINNFAAVLGVIALGLGIASLVIASKRHGGKGLGIASSIIAVVAIIIVFASQAFYGAAIDEVSESFDQAIEEAETGERAATDEEQEETTSVEPLAIGATGQLDDYEVTVDAVNLDAGEEVAAAWEYNEPAEAQYVLADLTATYTGAEEGVPWIELNVELVGSDSRIYSTTTCSAVLENEGYDQPNLTSGGTASFQSCFDVPAEALEDATLRVSGTLDFNGEPVVWNTK